MGKKSRLSWPRVSHLEPKLVEHPVVSAIPWCLLALKRTLSVWMQKMVAELLLQLLASLNLTRTCVALLLLAPD